MRWRMKHSLRVRLVMIFIAVLICSIGLIWCMNRFLLSTFYEKSKISQMDDVNTSVEGLCKDVKWGVLSQDESEQIAYSLDSLSANSGVSIYVATVYMNRATFKYPRKLDDWQWQESASQMEQYINSVENGMKLGPNYQVLYQNEQYMVYKVYDQRVGSNYIELINKVNDVTWVYMRMNYQSMQEGAIISNRLLAYAAGVVLIIGAIIIFFVSRSYTRPIMRLVEHARKMEQLDFDARYNEDREDEIGVLGSSMNALSSKLEQTISELKTANNELKLDIERKQEQEEMRTEFLANVSHELKTPIALIQGYAEGLQDNINEDAESREFYCEVIIDEANKMNKMVKKLLSLNELEFGNGRVHLERFDLVESIRSVVSINDIFIKQKDVTLSFSQDEPVFVWADESMIDEVITNYVSNALNHVDDKRVIEIKLQEEEKHIRVSVFNTGLPIPEEDIERIWDKFYKVDKARTREYGGNGIGLSIVKAIMDAHNQSYGVRNYDNGVEFWFTLEMN